MEITRLFDILDYQLNNNPVRNALVTKKDGVWQTTSTQHYHELVNELSRGLLRKGLKSGDKVALISTNNRTEWNIFDMALQQIGAIPVPVYPSISPSEYEFIFNELEIAISIVSDKDLFEKMLETRKLVPGLKDIYTFDKVEGANHWNELLELGKDTSNQSDVDVIKSNIDKHDTATIIYTSGTTGKPKGIVLSHHNIVLNVMACDARLPKMGEDGKALSFLPLCHVFERLLVYMYQFNSLPIYYAESIEALGENLKEVQPTVITVVPRLMEKVYDKIYEKGSTAGGIKSKLFMWALELTKTYEPFVPMKGLAKIKYQIADKLIFSKWREAVGGNMIVMISGSAKLSADLNRKFTAAGIPILEGYGLTEAAPVVTVGTLKKGGTAFGSVGSALDHLDLRIAEDGEIQVKGPSIFKEYYNNPIQTAETFTEDGYFKTGDIGELKEGLLYITDRKKQIFKTSGGKYIAPQVIQDALIGIPFIEQVMVVGEGQKMPTALIQPNFEYVREFIKKNDLHIENPTNEHIANSLALKELIREEINVVNQQFGKWEQIKRFELTPEEWTIENQLITPTLKHKRKNIKKHFIHLYNNMYDIKA